MSSRFLYAIAFVGGIGVLALVATLMIDHLELFGLRQVWDQLLLHLGFLLAFWATPRMTLAHLFFALATTAYIPAGVSMLLPLPRRSRVETDRSTPATAAPDARTPS